MPEDVAALNAEFPAWYFTESWVTAGSGPDGRTLQAFPLEGGDKLTAFDAEEMRRQIRKAGG